MAAADAADPLSGVERRSLVHKLLSRWLDLEDQRNQHGLAALAGAVLLFQRGTFRELCVGMGIVLSDSELTLVTHILTYLKAKSQDRQLSQQEMGRRGSTFLHGDKPFSTQSLSMLTAAYTIDLIHSGPMHDYGAKLVLVLSRSILAAVFAGEQDEYRIVGTVLESVLAIVHHVKRCKSPTLQLFLEQYRGPQTLAKLYSFADRAQQAGRQDMVAQAKHILGLLQLS